MYKKRNRATSPDVNKFDSSRQVVEPRRKESVCAKHICNLLVVKFLVILLTSHWVPAEVNFLTKRPKTKANIRFGTNLEPI